MKGKVVLKCHGQFMVQPEMQEHLMWHVRQWNVKPTVALF